MSAHLQENSQKNARGDEHGHQRGEVYEVQPHYNSEAVDFDDVIPLGDEPMDTIDMMSKQDFAVAPVWKTTLKDPETTPKGEPLDTPAVEWRCGTWQALVGSLRHEVSKTKYGSAHIFRDLDGRGKSKGNVTGTCYLFFDIEPRLDKETGEYFFPDYCAIVGQALGLGVAMLFWTTFNHQVPPELNDGKPQGDRLRGLVPLDGRIRPDEIKAATLVLAEMLGIKVETIDPKSYAAAQLMFDPRHREGFPVGRDVIDGRPLSVDALREAMAKRKQVDEDRRPPAPVPQPVRAVAHNAANHKRGEAFVAKVCRAIAATSVGARNDTLSSEAWSAYRKALWAGVDLGWVAMQLEAAAHSMAKPLPGSDIRDIVRRARKDAERDGPEALTDRDLQAAGDFERLPEQQEHAGQVGAVDEPRPKRFKVLSSKDVRAMPPIRWRIKGVVPQSGLGALYGASGSGKSFLALHMAACIATGREWFGYKTKPTSVVYCAFEGQAGFGQRMNAYEREHGRESLENVGMILEPCDIADVNERVGLTMAILEAGGKDGIVILDTLAECTPGKDENSSQDMKAVIKAAKEIQEKTGGLVLLIHHTGKNESAGMRGHSSLLGALDVSIEVSGDDTHKKWKVAKSKDGQGGITGAFKLDVVTLGLDDDGDPETSCVCRELEDVRPLKPTSKVSDYITQCYFDDVDVTRTSIETVRDPLLEGLGRDVRRQAVRELIAAGHVVEVPGVGRTKHLRPSNT